ncbi:hypothetical protein PG997_006595 [Apiospora hydei]|uniref:Uncharacterized protein n=1 Tax=Apiospora hydei TaxID=1337664 RepID=A0ABR1WRZ1_9PEZI
MSFRYMRARSVAADGKYYMVGGPIFQVVDHDVVDMDGWHNNIRYMTNREWCYYAECDLIIFALFFGDVVVTPPDEESESDYEETTDEDNDSDTDMSSVETIKLKKKKKPELDEVTNWPEVLDGMQEAHWGFDMEDLEKHWKYVIVPRLRAIREAHESQVGDSKIYIYGSYDYNALAALAATCHNRKVDPADHPHGYGEPLPTVQELYLERVCQEFGGKSAQLIQEEERALKRGRVLKRKRDRGGEEDRKNLDGDSIVDHD